MYFHNGKKEKKKPGQKSIHRNIWFCIGGWPQLYNVNDFPEWKRYRQVSTLLLSQGSANFEHRLYRCFLVRKFFVAIIVGQVNGPKAVEFWSKIKRWFTSLVAEKGKNSYWPRMSLDMNVPVFWERVPKWATLINRPSSWTHPPVEVPHRCVFLDGDPS